MCSQSVPIALCSVIGVQLFVVNLPFYAEIVSSYARTTQYGFIAYVFKHAIFSLYAYDCYGYQ